MHVQLAAYALSTAGACALLANTYNGGQLFPTEEMLTLTPGEVWYPWTTDGEYRDASASGSSGSDGGGLNGTGVPSGGGSAPSSRRMLKRAGAGPSTLEIEMFSRWEIRNEESWAVLWLLQSLAMACLMMHLANTVFMAFSDLFILLCSIFKMLRRDLATFMIVFLWFGLMFYCLLYTIYPRSGYSALPQVNEFNTHFDAIFALIDLSFLGERVTLNMLPESFEYMGAVQLVDLWLWLVFYYIFMIISIILMINLLIAMMSHTFDGIRQESLLQSRLGFALLVMKLELIAESFGMRTRVGEPTSRIEADGDQVHVYKFRAFEREADDDSDSDDGYEGDFDEGGSDPFVPPVSSTVTRVLRYVQEMKSDLMERHKMLLDAVKQGANPADAVELEGDAAPG